MTRELGVICDQPVVEALMRNSNITLGFDAMTQEDVKINSLQSPAKILLHHFN